MEDGLVVEDTEVVMVEDLVFVVGGVVVDDLEMVEGLRTWRNVQRVITLLQGNEAILSNFVITSSSSHVYYSIE